jgi:hypothetical protein
MKKDDLTDYLAEVDQSVKNFIATILEEFDFQIKQNSDPLVQMEYFGATMEIRLLSFGEVYGPRQKMITLETT